MLLIIYASLWIHHHGGLFLNGVFHRMIRINFLLGLYLAVGRYRWISSLVFFWINLRFCRELLRIILGLLVLWNLFEAHRISLSYFFYSITTHFLIISNYLSVKLCYCTFFYQHWHWIIPLLLSCPQVRGSGDAAIAISLMVLITFIQTILQLEKSAVSFDLFLVIFMILKYLTLLFSPIIIFFSTI